METSPVRMAPLTMEDYDLLPESSKLENNGHAVKLTNIYRYLIKWLGAYFQDVLIRKNLDLFCFGKVN